MAIVTGTKYVPAYPRTNEYVQSTLAEAITVLKSAPAPQDEYDVMRRNLLISYLELAKGYTASSNPIPGLGGLGLEQSVEIAHKVLAGEVSDSYRINFKHLGNAFLEI